MADAPRTETLGARYARVFERGTATERLVFFSDAVFAIALTLLVIDIRVPLDVDGGSAAVLLDALPSIYAYVLSFYVIAVNWMGHHRKFAHIKRFDARLITLNFLLLFVIAFVPFPTSMLAEYPGEVTSVVLYAGVVSALSLLQSLMWGYAFGHGFVDRDVDVALHRYLRRNLLSVPAVFLLSILIAVLWDPWIAMYSWILLLPTQIVLRRIGAKRTDVIPNPRALGAPSE
jgi:uncharacterized membrane protein